MSLIHKNISIYPATTLSQDAEIELITNILELVDSKFPNIQRRLSSYPAAPESEKDTLIIELMDSFWKLEGSSDLFLVFKDFEQVFTILEQKGHFIHSFEVFLLGWHLLNLLIKKGGKKILGSRRNIQKHIFYAWLLTSTAHDFGYPVQVAHELADRFSLLYNKIHMNNIADEYEKLSKNKNLTFGSSLLSVEAFDMRTKSIAPEDIELFILVGIQRSIIGNLSDAKQIREALMDKHGYISALILCRTYIDFLSKAKRWRHPGELWRVDILQMVAAAIALHSISMTHRNFIRKISFNSNPLAYLLILIDNLQDWNRSLRPNNEWPSYNLTHFQTSQKNDFIRLDYNLYHERWDAVMERRVKKSLAEKEQKLSLAVKPAPRIGFKININFSSNHGHKFRSINFSL